jgi:hypothetical protein
MPVRLAKVEDKEEGTYAECQIKDHLMRVKVLAVVTIAREHGEVRNWGTQNLLRDKRLCFIQKTVTDRPWDRWVRP